MGSEKKGKLSRHGMAVCAGMFLAGWYGAVPHAHSADAAELSQRSFWNTQGVASRDLRPFWKWRAVIQRYSQEMEQNRRRECSPSLFNDCPFDEWRRFLKDTAERGRWSQLVAVNAFMNARRYVADERNWGVSDYWATPGEFMSRAGDCEDFAIAKYLSLRELGWDAGDLRVVVVRDSELNVAHAVLVVFFGGRSWVLDNQASRVTETADIGYYRPVFSINETSWWQHRPASERDAERPPALLTPAQKADETPAGADPRL